MSAAAVAELALLQELREQQARGLAVAAERVRAERDQAARDARAALERELAHYAESRSAPRLCLDRVGLAAHRVTLAVTLETEASDSARTAHRDQVEALHSWHEAANKDQLLSRRTAQLRRAEDRKAADRRDQAAIEQCNAIAKDDRS